MTADNPETRWTVYGRVRTGVDASGRVQVRGFHADRLRSRDAAVLFVTEGTIQYKGGVDAVVVRLVNGVDKHGEREVIYRVGEGRAWWE